MVQNTASMVSQAAKPDGFLTELRKALPEHEQPSEALANIMKSVLKAKNNTKYQSYGQSTNQSSKGTNKPESHQSSQSGN